MKNFLTLILFFLFASSYSFSQCTLVATITSQTNESCDGSVLGTATVIATGGTAPYSYLWSNGQNTQTATGLTATNYTVTVTDAHGCVTHAFVFISHGALGNLKTCILKQTRSK